jgi:phospholipase D1/2
VDGHDFFYAVSEILEDAKETIFILGWWISPELHLRRPFKQNEEFRLDRLLLKKAQEGVKVMIIVCKKRSPRDGDGTLTARILTDKEVAAALSNGSKHTKHGLEDLHENISVMRHPQVQVQL